jgi:transposase InsO family protein
LLTVEDAKKLRDAGVILKERPPERREALDACNQQPLTVLSAVVLPVVWGGSVQEMTFFVCKELVMSLVSEGLLEALGRNERLSEGVVSEFILGGARFVKHGEMFLQQDVSSKYLWRKEDPADERFQSKYMREDSTGVRPVLTFTIASVKAGQEEEDEDVPPLIEDPELEDEFEAIKQQVQACEFLTEEEMERLMVHVRRLYAVPFNPTVFRDESFVLNVKPDVLVKGKDVFFQKKRFLTPEKRGVLNKFTREGVKQGILEEADAKTLKNVQNFVFVKKPNGSLRACVDFTDLNKITEDDPTSISSVRETLDGLNAKAKFFIVVDLKDGFYHIDMSPESVNRTGVYGAEKMFVFKRMPMGLKNAPAFFRRFMQKLVNGLPGVVQYFDDLLIEGESVSDLISNFGSLVNALVTNQIACSISKFQIGESVKLLGWIRTEAGLKVDPNKLEAILSLGAPSNVSELRSLLGMVRYLAPATPNLALLLRPLNDLLKKGVGFSWGKREEDCWSNVKEALKECVTQGVPDFSKPFHVYTDASEEGYGGYLCQPREGQEDNIIFVFSNTFNSTQRNWAVIEKELFSVITALDRVAPYVADRHFHLFTDHQPLLGLNKRVLDGTASSKLHRWVLKLKQFDFTLHHVPGRMNVLADALSRVPGRMVAASANGGECGAPPKDKEKEPDDSNDPGIQMVEVEWNDSSRERLRLVDGKFVVPPHMQEEVIQAAHHHPTAGHLGRDKTLQRLSRYTWKGMHAHVESAVANCGLCQRNKDVPVPSFEVQPWEVSGAFERVHIDTISMPMNEKGNRYVLTVSDAGTKFFVGVALPNKAASTVTKALMEKVFLIYGFPTLLVSDEGTEFVNSLNRELCESLGIQRHHTTPYRPAANGQVERAHRTLEAVLRSMIHPSQQDWEDWLPYAVFAMNTSSSRSTGMTPFFLMFGRVPYTLIDIVTDIPLDKHDLGEWMKRLWSARDQAAHKDARVRKVESKSAPESASVFKIGDHVLVKYRKTKRGAVQKLAPRQQGPFEIISLVEGVSAELRHCEFREEVVHRHVQDLVPFKGSKDDLGDFEWEVDQIVGERRVKGRRQYLVKFVGFPKSEWIWKDNLKADEAIHEWKSLKDSQKLSKKVTNADKVKVDRIVGKRKTREGFIYLCVDEDKLGPQDFVWRPESKIANFDHAISKFNPFSRTAPKSDAPQKAEKKRKQKKSPKRSITSTAGGVVGPEPRVEVPRRMTTRSQSSRFVN